MNRGRNFVMPLRKVLGAQTQQMPSLVPISGPEDNANGQPAKQLPQERHEDRHNGQTEQEIQTDPPDR
jgi:hypothetical protein